MVSLTCIDCIINRDRSYPAVVALIRHFNVVMENAYLCRGLATVEMTVEIIPMRLSDALMYVDDV